MAGLTTDAFNALMDDLFETLSRSFPREEAIKDARSAFALIAKQKDPAKAALPRKMFMDQVREHAPRMRERDNEYMSSHMDDIDFIKQLGIRKYWVSEHMPEVTRGIIWDKLNMLLMLGTALENVDPSMLPMIEQFAQSAIDNGEFQEGQMPDLNQIVQRMMPGVAGLTGSKRAD
jgi:hypothetical protein